MIKVEQSVVINRPIGEAFTFATDIENMLQWTREAMESKITSESKRSQAASSS